MTLRRRILLFYSLTLSFSLVIVGYWSWFEFEEQQKIIVHGGGIYHTPAKQYSV